MKETGSKQKLYDAVAVRELDRIAIEEEGIPGIVLMKRAGRAVFSELRRRWPLCNSITIFCGAGNNGGDGYVIAALAVQSNLGAIVFETPELDVVTGDAKLARDFALEQGVDIQPAANFSGEFSQNSLLVDALLGTGFHGEPRGAVADLLKTVAASRAGRSDNEKVPLVAVDVPSGLDASSGASVENAIKADLTVSFIGKKFGLHTGQGPALAGDIVFDELNVPASVYAEVPAKAEALSLAEEKTNLPARRKNNHKGNHGHVLVIGGDEGMGGAPLMSAMSAARIGAGLVSVATHPSHVSAILSRQPELMARGVLHANELFPLIERASVIAVGPGLGMAAWGQGLLQAALGSGLPMVLDADALRLMAAKESMRPCSDQIVMTPHPGEAANMLGISTTEIQEDRFASIEKLYQTFGGVQVLKGAGTLVRDGEQTLVCTYGNPGMGSGGMGDVLTGLIAGLLAQGLSAGDSAKLGVCLHSKAADVLAERYGQRGLLATDLIPVARELLRDD